MTDRPIDIAEGWTSPLDFQLLVDGAPLNLTGLTVTAILTHRAGTVDTAGDVTVTDAAQGKVAYTPDPTDLTAAAGSYRLRFKVVDGAGAIVYFPPGLAQAIKVHRP